MVKADNGDRSLGRISCPAAFYRASSLVENPGWAQTLYFLAMGAGLLWYKRFPTGRDLKNKLPWAAGKEAKGALGDEASLFHQYH